MLINALSRRNLFDRSPRSLFIFGKSHSEMYCFFFLPNCLNNYLQTVAPSRGGVDGGSLDLESLFRDLSGEFRKECIEILLLTLNIQTLIFSSSNSSSIKILSFLTITFTKIYTYTITNNPSLQVLFLYSFVYNHP